MRYNGCLFILQIVVVGYQDTTNQVLFFVAANLVDVVLSI
jgi:hypothetical protein